MSQPGPILVVSSDAWPPFLTALDEAKMFPVVDAGFAALAEQIAARKPYLPLIAVAPKNALPENAVPFTPSRGNVDRLVARLRAALRIRALHATVLRRLEDEAAQTRLPDTDPARDATVLLLGRGAAFPALSVALGERMGVVGAFSIEAAANHLNTRDVNGIVLGEGFSARA